MWHTHAQGQRAIVHVAPGVQDEQSATSSFRAGRGHNRTRGGKQHHTSSAEGTTLEHVQHPCHPRQFTSNRTGFAAVPRVIVPRRREEQGRNRADEVLCMLPEKGGGWRAWLKGVMGTETRVPSWMSRGHCHTRRGGRGHAHHTGRKRVPHLLHQKQGLGLLRADLCILSFTFENHPNKHDRGGKD